MIETVYHDLKEFGLPLIIPSDPTFGHLSEEIRSRDPFPARTRETPARGAVLENKTGRAVVTLAHVWRYTEQNGKTRTSRHSNLGSGRQMDVLMGKEKGLRDQWSFILPGSKRLITENNMLGDNSDVIEPYELPPGGGRGFAGGTARGTTERDDDGLIGIELSIDVAILDDGLCVGPDETGLCERLKEEMQLQKETAMKIVERLQEGASEGQIFEILQPLARFEPPARTALLSMFARSAINHLVNMNRDKLVPWFEEAASVDPLHLHRPPGRGARRYARSALDSA
jgi:hypothetical protein